MNGLKIQGLSIYAAYSRLASNVRKHTDWKWSDGKRCFMEKETNEQKAGVAILISDKIDLKAKTVMKDKQGIT